MKAGRPSWSNKKSWHYKISQTRPPSYLLRVNLPGDREDRLCLSRLDDEDASSVPGDIPISESGYGGWLACITVTLTLGAAEYKINQNQLLFT